MNHLTNYHINEFADDVLSPAEREEAQLHFDKCPQCRQQLNALLTLDTLLHNMPLESVPQDFTQRVMMKVNEKPFWVYLWKPLTFLVSIIAAVVVAVLGLMPFPSHATPSVTGQYIEHGRNYYEQGFRILGEMLTKLIPNLSSGFALQLFTVGMILFAAFLVDKFVLVPKFRKGN
jgi:hypothetical protein